MESLTHVQPHRSSYTKHTPTWAVTKIREKAGVSQAVFAEHLGVTTGLISKWECGDKKPSRMALKLLGVVKARGLEAVA